MKKKLARYDIVKAGASWALKCGKFWAKVSISGESKKAFVSACARFCRNLSGNGQPVSLRIRGVNGRIQEERTYPRSADPKRSKG